MNQLKVSIIIPTWNREKEVVKAVKSVLKQTITNIEVLVCDDSSTDNTQAAIKKINDPIERNPISFITLPLFLENCTVFSIRNPCNVATPGLRNGRKNII